MKLTVNKGVRDTMQELHILFDEYNALTELLADGNTANSLAMDAGLDRLSTESDIVSAAARLLSHATRGKLFPLMTDRFYGKKP